MVGYQTRSRKLFLEPLETRRLLASDSCVVAESFSGADGETNLITEIPYYDSWASLASIGDLDGDGVSDMAVGGSDHLQLLYLNADGSTKSVQEVVSGSGEPLGFDGSFGESVAAIGDVNGDGVIDLAVGAPMDSAAGLAVGAVHVLLMNGDGTVQSSRKITHDGADVILLNQDRFGSSVAGIGDFDGDGVPDIAAGALLDDSAGQTRGAIYILPLNSDGSLKASAARKITHDGQQLVLPRESQFGHAVTSLGDLDGDGVTDLAVGTPHESSSLPSLGAVHILFMNADATVKSVTKISHDAEHFPLADQAFFGQSVTSLGDIDGDGLTDIAVGVGVTDRADDYDGGVYILNLNADGTVKSHRLLTHGGELPDSVYEIHVGFSVASLADPAGNGPATLAVSAQYYVNGFPPGGALGAIYLFELPSHHTDCQHRESVDGIIMSHKSIVLQRAEQDVDLAELVAAKISGYETIDIVGTGDNTLRLTQEAVVEMAPETRTLLVRSDAGDTVIMEHGWQFQTTEVLGDEFVRVLTRGAATLQMIGPLDWNNPVNYRDVSGNGSVEPLDALKIINELNSRRYSSADGQPFGAAATATFPGFFDASGDGFVTPLDALFVINWINDTGPTTAEGENAALNVVADFTAGDVAVSGFDQVSDDESIIMHLSPDHRDHPTVAVVPQVRAPIVQNHTAALKRSGDELVDAINALFAQSDWFLRV